MSGARVAAAFDPAKFDVSTLDLADLCGGDANRLGRLLGAGENGRPDVVFIALHGGAGENGTVQGLLELLDLPYTGSGVLASALAMDKTFSKRLFAQAGLPTPAWMVVSESARRDAPARIVSALGLPCVIKPTCEGSTIGISIVREPGRASRRAGSRLSIRPGGIGRSLRRGHRDHRAGARQ